MDNNIDLDEFFTSYLGKDAIVQGEVLTGVHPMIKELTALIEAKKAEWRSDGERQGNKEMSMLLQIALKKMGGRMEVTRVDMENAKDGVESWLEPSGSRIYQIVDPIKGLV